MVAGGVLGELDFTQITCGVRMVVLSPIFDWITAIDSKVFWIPVSSIVELVRIGPPLPAMPIPIS